MKQIEIQPDRPFISEPIFLVGAERSGTTLLRLMLDHHPKLSFYSEFEYAVDRISDSSSWPELNDYYQWLETHRIFQSSKFKIDRTLSYPQLIESFLDQKRDRDGKPLVGATVHRHFDRLLQIWSDARFIHIIRDPRDVARSCVGKGWAGNVWTGVERWIEAERLWVKLSQTIPADRRIELTYENLILEPIETLTRLCHFMNLPYDKAMINYAQTSTYDLPDASFIGQWRRKLSDRDIQLVEARVADMLVERGYELSGLPRITVTPVIEQRLRLQDWLARAQFRLKRNGLPLFMSDYLSRHLRLKSWQKRIKLELNAIETKRLK